jgi:hypothetical protein
MSNPTTPFSWQMPTATDLVTDLPADFEVFGQAVATSMADLLGGTTGQVLSKTSNTDMDFTWIAANPGDITGVTAGVGITGGGTSGTVTVTNDMATTITAAGDIVVGTGSGTYDNLPIGTTAQVLTADTTVSPYKVKWATPAGGTPTFTGCSLFNSTTQSCASGVSTILTFNSERADSDAFHSTVTNTGRITIPTGKAGKYLFGFMIDTGNVTTGTNSVNVQKNGTYIDISGRVVPANIQPVSSGNFILDLAVADYIDLSYYQQSGGNAPILSMSFTALFLGA